MKSAQRLLDQGRVESEGRIVHKSERIESGQELNVLIFEPASIGLEPIFVTPHFAVFDKPSKLLSHPRYRNDDHTLLDAARGLFGNDSNCIHRLDFETSGVVMVGRNRKSEAALKGLFENREVQKSYIALASGIIEHEIEIDAPIAINQDRSVFKQKSYVSETGKSAQTRIVPLRRIGENTLVRAFPKSGRLHQIRLHLHHIGHRILGDTLYGIDAKIASDFLDGHIDEMRRVELFGARRIMLHSVSLEFTYEEIRYVIMSNKGIEEFLSEM